MYDNNSKKVLQLSDVMTVNFLVTPELHSKAWHLNSNSKILHPPPCALDAVEILLWYYNTIARKPTMIANNAAPSTSAAVRIMFPRMSLEASG